MIAGAAARPKEAVVATDRHGGGPRGGGDAPRFDLVTVRIRVAMLWCCFTRSHRLGKPVKQDSGVPCATACNHMCICN